MTTHSPLNIKHINLKQVHIDLLQRINLLYKNAESIHGNVRIWVDSLRPYGNMDWGDDIAELLGFECDHNGWYTDAEIAQLLEIQNQMAVVIEIRLHVNEELTPGSYIRPRINELWRKETL